MITSVVGKTFLEAYNKKYATDFSPKDFFEKVYFELFYNHPKYMQWITNSPFVQMKSGQKPHLLSTEERAEKLQDLFEKIENDEPDGSFALGFPASESKAYASTSGLVSDVAIPTTSDDVYLSWIGSGLGIGVAGGFSILFDNAELTLQTFDGWKIYRKYLQDSTLDKLRGNQINTWNGQWLTYSLDSKAFREDFDFTDLTDQKIVSVSATMVEVNTVNWSQLFFSLSQLFPSRELTGYVYGFGQTNKTIGFIPFQLKSGTRLIDIYTQLFGDLSVDKKVFESLFGMHIKRACELGSIGMLALRPEGITKYMGESKNISLKNDQDTLNYFAYKTWLMAMLTKNKEEITTYTLELAETILRYRKDAKGTDRKNLIEKKLFAAKSKRGFIDALAEMVGDVEGQDLEVLKTLKDEVHMMTNEEFGYFCTLLKFDYAFVEKKS